MSEAQQKGCGSFPSKRLFLTKYLYITALWWPLCFLILNWGRRRNSALQVSFSAEEQFPTTSRKKPADLWASPSTLMGTHTQAHTFRAMHRAMYTQVAPDTSSCLCALLCNSLHHPRADFPGAELQRPMAIQCVWPLVVRVLWTSYYSSVCACMWHMSLCIQK